MVVPMAKSRMSNNPPMKKGKGFFDVVKSVGKAVAPMAIDAGSKALKKRLGGGMCEGAGFFDFLPYSQARKAKRIRELADKKSGNGFFDVVKKIGKAVAPMAIDAGRKLLKDKYGIGVDLSTAQLRSLKKGGAIQIKPSQVLEQGKQLLQLLPQSAKKLMTALKKSKGMRLLLKEGEDVIDKMTGGSIFKSLLKAVAPMAIDAGSKALKQRLGGGMEDMGGGFRPAGRRGSGFFDVLKSVGKALAPMAIDAGSKALKKRLGGGFMPAGGGFKPAGGGFMPAGGAMPIQLGSPFQSMSSPAMNPFVGTTGLSGYAPITAGSQSGGAMMPIRGRMLRPRLSNPVSYTPEYVSMM